MECEEIQSHLTALLDDELSATEKSKIEVHLAECKRCTEELQRLSQTLRLVDQWQVSLGSINLWGAIEEKISLPYPEPRGILASIWHTFRAPALAPLAAVAILGIAFGVVSGFSPDLLRTTTKTQQYLQAVKIDALKEIPPNTVSESYFTVVVQNNN
ncbi:MAG: zf-HC2 domain-containing protein [Planctomycetota bacterium]